MNAGPTPPDGAQEEADMANRRGTIYLIVGFDVDEEGIRRHVEEGLAPPDE
jgi:hypothetical protein